MVVVSVRARARKVEPSFVVWWENLLSKVLKIVWVC